MIGQISTWHLDSWAWLWKHTAELQHVMFAMLYMLILGSSLVATLAILARVRVRNHDHIFIFIVRGGDHSYGKVS